MGAGAVAISYAVEQRPVSRQPQQPTPEGQKVADVFKALRADADITQEEAARRVDLTLSGYRPYEQGRRQLRIEQLPTFARAFGVSTDRLSAELGLANVTSRQLRLAQCADILGRLDDQPPEITDTILQWLRESVNIALIGRQGRTN
jgi:transcriptional regulator with XRE-family HTH domain